MISNCIILFFDLYLTQKMLVIKDYKIQVGIKHKRVQNYRY